MGEDESVTTYTYAYGDLLAKEVTQHSNGESSKSYYYYDDDGNLILRGNESTVFGSLQNATAFGVVSPTVSAFSYNGYGELTSATVNGVTTTYDYRPDGLRRSKTTLGVKTTHVWDGDDVIMDLDTALNVKAKYPRGLNLIECDMGTLSTEQYMHNYHGDVIGTVNSSTGDRTGYDYDAYGNQTSIDADNLNPFRYSGEYYDSETGFIYLRARYYDTTTGRFISEDPARDGANWYAYCAGNPVMYVDPSGYLKEGDKERFGENSTKYKMLEALGDAWADTTDGVTRYWIEHTADKLRSFDDSSISSAVFMNDSSGASNLGHSAVMLINNSGESIIFSYYPTNETLPDAICIDGEMRFNVYSAEDTEYMLRQNGTAPYMVTVDGKIVGEKYNRFARFDVSYENGKKMFNSGADFFKNPGKYKLLSRNCDHIAQETMNVGEILYSKHIFFPNKTYERLKELADEVWEL